MKTQRLINLDLRTIKLPITAIVSILHRISGIILFIMIGFVLWILKLSLSSPESFIQIVTIMNNYIIKFVTWIFLNILVYHLVAGVRYILMDCGYLTETLLIGRITAYTVFLLTIIVSILLGILLLC